MENIQTQPVVNQAPVQEAAPQAAPQSIPYDRFASVVAQKNALQEQLNQFAAQMQPQVQGQPASRPIETVDDLLGTVEARINARLGEAEKTRLAPLENQLKDYRFQNTIEGYFSNPERNALRKDMDAYTATIEQGGMLTPQEQAFLKDQVANGRTQWLDQIYYYIASQKQNSLVNQAASQSQQSAGIAQTPTQYRSVGTVEPSLKDRIGNAKQTGDWNSVFSSLVPPQKG